VTSIIGGIGIIIGVIATCLYCSNRRNRRRPTPPNQGIPIPNQGTSNPNQGTPNPNQGGMDRNFSHTNAPFNFFHPRAMMVKNTILTHNFYILKKSIKESSHHAQVKAAKIAAFATIVAAIISAIVSIVFWSKGTQSNSDFFNWLFCVRIFNSISFIIVIS
jgi:hypothetical protein